MDHKISNQEARQKIKNISIDQKVKGLKVPTKLTNLYHKKIKAAKKMYEPSNIDKIRTEGDKKIILLSPQFKIQDLQLNEQQSKQIQLVECDVHLNYTNLTTQQIFNQFQDLKPGQEPIPFPHSFQTAGHIAHYNLTPEQEKFKEVIGEITLAKCGNIRTVANKTQKLHNVYRTPILEHMAGQKSYYVNMKEVGVSFQFDFEKVYWCSRLQKERDRVLQFIKPQECLADLFCGVGPLAVRAAKKGAYVIANDLNPSCYEYLVKNAKLNKVQNRMKCWNMCAREAVRKIIKEHNQYEPGFQNPDHFYMNLPVDAIEFLDALRQYGSQMNGAKMPLVHVNCFVVAEDDQKSAELLVTRVNKVLPGFKREDIVSLHHIKNVTVIMRMYCMSFRLRQKYQQNKQQEIVDKVQKKIKQK